MFSLREVVVMHNFAWILHDWACRFFLMSVVASMLSWASFRSNRRISEDIADLEFAQHSILGLVRYIIAGFFGFVMLVTAFISGVAAAGMLAYGIVSNIH